MNRMDAAKELVGVARSVVGGQKASAAEVARILKGETGMPFKANWTGAWDRADANSPRVVTVNRGNGFEPAVAVRAGGGEMVYMGPFEVDNMPSEDAMFLFYCGDALFVKGL